MFVQELLRLHRGQGRDIHWRDTGVCPTEDEYNAMVIDKTGGLFRLAVGLMQAFSTTNLNLDFTPLLNKLALYFQIRDDLINLADTEYMKSKSFCEDLVCNSLCVCVCVCARVYLFSILTEILILSLFFYHAFFFIFPQDGRKIFTPHTSLYT